MKLWVVFLLLLLVHGELWYARVVKAKLVTHDNEKRPQVGDMKAVSTTMYSVRVDKDALAYVPYPTLLREAFAPTAVRPFNKPKPFEHETKKHDAFWYFPDKGLCMQFVDDSDVTFTVYFPFHLQEAHYKLAAVPIMNKQVLMYWMSKIREKTGADLPVIEVTSRMFWIPPPLSVSSEELLAPLMAYAGRIDSNGILQDTD
jgi:hypothetical protein